MQWVIHSREELSNVAAAILSKTSVRKKILLQGDLGAGKTAFVQAFCAHLGVRGQVTSPTFSLINEYSYTDPDGRERILHHIDLYRLKRLDEAIDIGIEDYLFDEDFCLIEWPELIETIAPPDALRIFIEMLPDSSRKILLL